MIKLHILHLLHVGVIKCPCTPASIAIAKWYICNMCASSVQKLTGTGATSDIPYCHVTSSSSSYFKKIPNNQNFMEIQFHTNC